MYSGKSFLRVSVSGCFSGIRLSQRCNYQKIQSYCWHRRQNCSLIINRLNSISSLEKKTTLVWENWRSWTMHFLSGSCAFSFDRRHLRQHHWRDDLGQLLMMRIAASCNSQRPRQSLDVNGWNSNAKSAHLGFGQYEAKVGDVMAVFNTLIRLSSSLTTLLE